MKARLWLSGASARNMRRVPSKPPSCKAERDGELDGGGNDLWMDRKDSPE